MLRIYWTLLLIAVYGFCGATPRLNIQETRDSLFRTLAHKTTPKDSIATLYDLYDLSERGMRAETGMIIYDVASRAGDTAVQLDILRNNTNLYLGSDSIMEHYQNLAESLPDSDDKEETLTFILVNRLSYKYRRAGESERQEIMKKLIKQYDRGGDDNDNIHAGIRRLYELCVCLSISSQGDLYSKYMKKLGELIDNLPKDRSNAVRNMYLTQRAIIESYKQNYPEAVAADKELLKEIGRLKKMYREKGRNYRNYDVNEYLCFTRLLGNFPELKPEEVERYYKSVNSIASRNEDVARDLESNKRATIYYLMANRRYAEALPLLKEQVLNDKNRQYRRQFFRFMTEAAEAVGDKETQLYAVKSYNIELEAFLQNEAIDRYNELQILYDVSDLKAEKARLQIEKQTAETSWHHKALILSAIALVLLISLIIVLAIMYTRTRRLAVSLEQSKVNLQNEKKNLLETQEELVQARDQAEQASMAQTQFIQNMRHEILTPLNAITGFSQLIVDSVPDNMKGGIDRYSQIISENSELLRTLVNDVLDISMMECGEIRLSRQPVSLRKLCALCVTNMSRKTREGVEMEFAGAADKADFTLFTDPVRVEQVLNNFLSNAVKYTDSGKITLDYEVDEKRNEVVFSVTDTGIGVPDGKEEVIFERFVKLSRYQTGTGLGLHICRFIAEMLGGRVMVDTSYSDGARFLFILPIDGNQGTDGTL